MIRGKLGRKPSVPDPRVPKLMDRLTPNVVRTVSATKDWSGAVKAYPMLGNDQVGDCTCAAVYHMVQTWLANHGVLDYVPTTADALALYEMVSKYPAEDDGADMQTVLTVWATKGIFGDDAAEKPSFAALTPGNLDELRYVIATFGGAYLGLNMPLTAQAQQDVGGAWDVVTNARAGAAVPGSWGRHCVNAVGYYPGYFEVVSWGGIVRVTEAFMQTYLDEAFAVLNEEWLSESGFDPDDVDMAALTADMKALT